MIIISHPARTIPGGEYFNNKTQTFFKIKPINIPSINLKLEHSLIRMSKWEAKWHKPFDPKTLSMDELLDYIRCMNVNQSDQTDVYKYLSQKDITDILEYMADPQTAWVDPREAEKKKKKKKEKDKGPKTVEEIYFAMVNLNLDPEFFGKWHINRLVALINYFDYQNTLTDAPKAPMSKKTEAEILAHYHELNQKNRAKFKSKG